MKLRFDLLGLFAKLKERKGKLTDAQVHHKGMDIRIMSDTIGLSPEEIDKIVKIVSKYAFVKTPLEAANSVSEKIALEIGCSKELYIKVNVVATVSQLSWIINLTCVPIRLID
ncbi:MAG: hypothetical protein HFJ55_00130 [Clostridia bacterium]|jgi:hypothetical protein|nr:hypothetical protein [Clostridia bacterium]